MMYNAGDTVHIADLNDDGVMQQAVVINGEDNGSVVVLTSTGVRRVNNVQSICITDNSYCSPPPAAEWRDAAVDELTTDIVRLQNEVEAERQRITTAKADLIKKGRFIARDNGRGAGLEELFRRTGFTTPQVDVVIHARYGKPSTEHLLDEWVSARLESTCAFDVWVDSPGLECSCRSFDPYVRVDTWLKESYPDADFTGIGMSSAAWTCSADDHDYNHTYRVGTF